MRTRREWLRATAFGVAQGWLWAARKEFWETKDPGTWTEEQKQVLLFRSPWAREGFARMEEKQASGGGGYKGQQVQMPDPTPAGPPTAVKSVPIGEPIPRAPKQGGEPVQFRVVARWETATPVRLAGGPEVPELTGQFYVIRLRGLPLMPPAKPKPGEPTVDPNEGMLQAIQAGSRLERKGKAAIVATHLFTGSGNAATDVLLFFPRGADPVTMADKVVTLESRFAVFHLTIPFPLKEMVYQGALAL